jgi:hypothetical protein
MLFFKSINQVKQVSLSGPVLGARAQRHHHHRAASSCRRPDPEFGGVIKNGALQSTPWWAPRIVPPKEAPNVLLIITDDAGFGVPSTFGGVIPTPTMDRIARAACATTTSTPPRCARRRGPR